MTYKEMNDRLLNKLSIYLNEYSDYIKKEDIDSMLDVLDNEKECYSYLLATILGLDIDNEDRELFSNYFPKMVNHLRTEDYLSNPYLNNIKINHIKGKNWEFRKASYKPYEAFVCDDFLNDNGKIIPQIGFFSEKYSFPAVYQNDRLWMSIVPNEVNTMKEDLNKIEGNILVCGLGLGYFSYMASLKAKVSSITIVEIDEEVIDLFKTFILPQFEYKDKIKLIKADAVSYIKNNYKAYDYVYIDLWHDVSDGLPIYLDLVDLRKNEKKTKFLFWIEKTMKCYVK